MLKKNIHAIIPFLEKSLAATILDYTVAPLTKQGDNFGSTLIAMNIKVKIGKNGSNSNEVKTVKLAVKFPVTNEILTSIFQPSITCVKENSFYTEIVPVLIQLQRQCGIEEHEFIDVFIQCYGARTTIGSNKSVADQNALLVLENIKAKGFNIGDRSNGFDKTDTEAILENMAKFHALPIALRHLQPKIFDEKIRPHLQRINLYERIDKNGEICQSLCNSINNVHGLDSLLRQKIIQQLRNCSDWRNSNATENDSPYTGISHCDMWTNNIMFKRDSIGRIENVKFIDYQLMTYDSFANDLVFFLFSSVNHIVRRAYIEHFFEYYHEHFYSTLALLQCPLDDYTYEKCRIEIGRRAKYEMEHLLNMLRVILAEKQSKPGELNADFFLRDDFVGQRFYQYLYDLISEFEQLRFI